MQMLSCNLSVGASASCRGPEIASEPLAMPHLPRPVTREVRACVGFRVTFEPSAVAPDAFHQLASYLNLP